MKRKLHRDNIWAKAGTCVGLCLLATLLISTASAAGDKEKSEVTVKPVKTEMLQDGEMPELKAEVSVKGDKDLILDKDTGYSVSDLADSLGKGENYQLTCKADGKTDGEFPIQVELSGEIESSLIREWLGKVKINTEEGTFIVKNKYGEWEGDKFKKTDGEYAASEFIVSRGKTYYFGEDGEKETGWIEKDGKSYYLNKKGVMQTGWAEKDGSQCYLTADGSMAVGWTEIDGAKYYFNAEGKAATGEQQIGTKKCVFAKDGKLESEENSIDPDKPMLALTFDDGPGPETGKILDVLEKYGARATFFMLAPKVEKYPDTVKRMQEIGCELANHSTTHTDLTTLSEDGIKKEIGTTASAVSEATGGFSSTLVRPPYGAVNDKVKASVGQPIIMWSIDTLDWKTRDVESTINSAVNTTKDGDIVLMHDIHSPTVEAAVKMIPMLIEKGYQLVTVSELAEARGIDLENGVRYSQFYK